MPRNRLITFSSSAPASCHVAIPTGEAQGKLCVPCALLTFNLPCYDNCRYHNKFSASSEPSALQGSSVPHRQYAGRPFCKWLYQTAQQILQRSSRHLYLWTYPAINSLDTLLACSTNSLARKFGSVEFRQTHLNCNAAEPTLALAESPTEKPYLTPLVSSALLNLHSRTLTPVFYASYTATLVSTVHLVF